MSDNTFKTISPINNSVLLERPYATDFDINSTLRNAIDAQVDWRNVSIEQRAKLCFSAIDILLQAQDEIAKEITQQMGRPIKYAAGEIAGFAERARYMIRIAENKLADFVVDEIEGYTRFIRRQPLGVVFSISPWNYPYLTAVNSIIPAIMAGNAVILKPSAQAPLTGDRLQSMFDEAGLPKGVFQNLYLDHQQTQTLIQKSEIDYVAFTGSVNGGHAIQAAVKDRFIDVGLELGGKDPAYVREDANLSTAVPNLVDGVYFNSGQSCCSIERIYVHESVYAAFVEQFVLEVNKYILGDPMDAETSLGPMVRESAADFVRQQIKEAVDAGAETLIDPSRFFSDESNAAYLPPQVLVSVNHTMGIMRNESFGPVVGIMSVKTDDEAIELMNDSDFGLTASVWTKDEEAALEIGEKIKTGTFFMNRCDYLDPALAWSGFKQSGRGCTLSEMGYEKLTRPQSFHLKRRES